MTEYAKKELMAKISTEYSIPRYQLLSGDRCLENVPHSLKKLWYSEDSRVISVSTMDVFYLLSRSGLIPEAEFITMLTGLEAALSHEFGLLHKANAEGRRKYQNEGS